MVDEIGDGELLDMPRPRRTMRAVTVAVMVVTAVVASWLAWSLRAEVGYALGSSQAAELGDLSQAELAAHDGHYVRLRAELADAPSVRYRRVCDRGIYRAALAVPGEAGAQRWVVYGIPETLAGPRFVPPTLVAGRLVRVADLSVRFGGLRDALDELSGRSSAGAWVLVDGEDPASLGWVLGLEALLLTFIGFNLLSLGRVLRRIRPSDD